MKVKDLMIGDYVTFKDSIECDNIPMKVKIVALGYQHRGEEDEALVQIDDDNAYDIVNIDNEFVGYPLTPEILEKNEFECKHKGEALKRLYWILNVGGGSVKVKINRGLFLFNIFGVPFQHGFYRPFVNKHIQYVHELQHALRLCGITKEIEL